LEARKAAADALERIGVNATDSARDAVPALLKALKDKEPAVRRHAAAALGNFWLDADLIAPALIDTLGDSDATVIKAACHALARLGPVSRAAIPNLIRLTGNQATIVRRSAAQSLGDIGEVLYSYGSTGDIAALNNAYQALSTSPDSEVKKHAARVKRTLDYLNLIWWGDAVQWPVHHPYLTLGIGVYPSLLLLCLVLFWLMPGSLLAVNEKLSSSEVELPSWLGGIKVPVRHVLLVGFFRNRPRVLDAWVRKYIANAQRQFLARTTVDQRKVHVTTPVSVEDRIIPQLRPQDLRPIFQRNRIGLLIHGEGGAGKTSLACQIAKWAMDDEPDRRVSPAYQIVPILIEQSVGAAAEADTSLLAIIRNQLTALIDAVEPPGDQLIRELLKRKRLLVIVDSLSEMTEASRTNVLNGINDLRINACIFTSRTDVALNTKTLVKPQLVRGNQLSSFMDAYLVTREKRQLFEDDEFFDACKRLTWMVANREITALLAKSYADQLIAAKEEGRTDLPQNIPDLMINYVGAISRPPAAEPDFETVIWAAKIIAWLCLKNSFRSTTASRSEILKVLGEQKGPGLLGHLKDNLRIVQAAGAAGEFIRFSLDPLAEYLAALYLVDEYGEDEQKWRKFLAEADAMEGAPEAIKGFLIAVHDSCVAKPKETPAFIVEELSKRGGLEPEDSSAAYERRRMARMLSQMKSMYVEERREAATALAFDDSEVIIAALTEALSDPDMYVRSAAAQSFGFKKSAGSVQLSKLMVLTKDQSSEVRRSATYALFNLKPANKQVISILLEAINDEDQAVALTSANAVVEIARALLPEEPIPAEGENIEISRINELGQLAMAELEKRENGTKL
jgi:HEAT repeat protein